MALRIAGDTLPNLLKSVLPAGGQGAKFGVPIPMNPLQSLELTRDFGIILRNLVSLYLAKLAFHK